MPTQIWATIRAMSLSLMLVTSAVGQVTNLNDNGPGSLREVVANASTGNRISFEVSLSGETIRLTGGEVAIDKALTMSASSLPEGIALSGGGMSRVFQIASAGSLALHDLSIRDGKAVGASPDGGGIAVAAFGILTVERCTISDCIANRGGAISSEGTVNLLHTTLANNQATDLGGALCTRNSGSLTLTQRTVSSNSARDSAGGIGFLGSDLHWENTIVAGNSAPTQPNYNSSPTTATGANLLGGTPKLAPLGHYGGPTQTMHPLAGSPAINAAGMTNPGGTDQGGFSRFIGRRK